MLVRAFQDTAVARKRQAVAWADKKRCDFVRADAHLRTPSEAASGFLAGVDCPIAAGMDHGSGVAVAGIGNLPASRAKTRSVLRSKTPPAKRGPADGDRGQTRECREGDNARCETGRREARQDDQRQQREMRQIQREGKFR